MSEWGVPGGFRREEGKEITKWGDCGGRVSSGGGSRSLLRMIRRLKGRISRRIFPGPQGPRNLDNGKKRPDIVWQENRFQRTRKSG